MLLPARTAVLNYFYSVKNADVKEVMNALKAQYGNEGQFTKERFLDHIMSLEANGLLNLTGYDLDKDGELVMRYEINEDGRTSVEKYVPKQYRKKS